MISPRYFKAIFDQETFNFPRRPRIFHSFQFPEMHFQADCPKPLIQKRLAHTPHDLQFEALDIDFHDIGNGNGNS